jgi:hypothetical protein
MDRMIRNLSWPPGDGKHIYPDDAIEAGRQMNYAGVDVTTARDGIGARLESQGSASPWGKDDIGKQLEKSYAEMAPLTLKIWKSVGTAVENMGTNIQSASKNITAADQAGGQQIQQAGNHHPDIPV